MAKAAFVFILFPTLKRGAMNSLEGDRKYPNMQNVQDLAYLNYYLSGI